MHATEHHRKAGFTKCVLEIEQGRKMGLEGGVLKACSGKTLCCMMMLQSPRRYRDL